ncbi:MAG: hypothetical protein ACTTK0_10010, partial [Stomatobaculum sp.]
HESNGLSFRMLKNISYDLTMPFYSLSFLRFSSEAAELKGNQLHRGFIRSFFCHNGEDTAVGELCRAAEPGIVCFWITRFYHEPVMGCLFSFKKECRIYADSGVSQTPKMRTSRNCK